MFKEKINSWARQNLAGIFIFNLVLIILVLLRFAGYFSPYFTININVIYLASLVLAIALLSAGNRVVFVIALCLWFLAAFLKAAGVDVWAERAVEYFFQAVLVGILLLFFGR